MIFYSRICLRKMMKKFSFFSRRAVRPKNEQRDYDILWDELELCPSVQLKFGIKRKLFPLDPIKTDQRGALHYSNNYIDLKGEWDNSPGFGSLLSFKLTNRSSSSVRITRIVFPTENGLNDFIRDFETSNISFLRNGYQSWSTARSYKLKDKPLRPWLQVISLASSNMANLPSNTRGILSSEMFSIITDLDNGDSFLVGQSSPFDQFFYIRLNLYKNKILLSHFELVYDFGRKMLAPGETIELDGIIMAKGISATLQDQYFSYIKDRMKIEILDDNLKGWCSWYYYYNKITPEIILKNLKHVQERKLPFDYLQIDDGYQKYVGDWLVQTESFEGRMKELASTIRDAGYIPGIWIAPFIADRKSELVRNHPEYVLRNEYGKPITAGYNFFWPGHIYYGLDITHPRFEEYIRGVIRHIVQKWGYKFFKCDFLFGGCLRGGNHHELAFSRAEVLKHGMRLLREEAGEEATIIGCGMPLSTGIGTVEIMRVGPDTGPYWLKKGASFLNTGAMVGVRNSLRNFMVRSGMHNRLWLNDPDCLMIRDKRSHLTGNERMTQINAIILSGGLLSYSDDLSLLSEKNYQDIDKINQLNNACFRGSPIALDLMEREIPELYDNSAGYLGVFNFREWPRRKTVYLSDFEKITGVLTKLTDIWNGEEHVLSGEKTLSLKNMPPHSSQLFRCEKDSS